MKLIIEVRVFHGSDSVQRNQMAQVIPTFGQVVKFEPGLAGPLPPDLSDASIDKIIQRSTRDMKKMCDERVGKLVKGMRQ